MYLNKLSTICLQSFREKNPDSVKITFDMDLTGDQALTRVFAKQISSASVLGPTRSMPVKGAQLPRVHPVIQA